MAMNNTEFAAFLKEQLESQKNIYVPVNSSFLEKVIHASAKPTDLHPNPEDEFCFPSVGPSYRIIGEYEAKYVEVLQGGGRPDIEPLTVLKAHPNGYILVNGHHRWAAALKVGMKRVPIKIINVMLEKDIRKVLENSVHDKRVTLDLDEVVFRAEGDTLVEKAPGFIFGKIFSKRVRLGIPALFKYLKSNGYDIWVYTSESYSIDDLERFFKRYAVYVDGIMTGFKNKKSYESEASKAMRELIANKYKETIHIDNDLLLITHSNSSDFEEFDLNPDDANWSKSIIDIMEERDKAQVDSQN